MSYAKGTVEICILCEYALLQSIMYALKNIFDYRSRRQNDLPFISVLEIIPKCLHHSPGECRILKTNINL